MEYLCLVIIMDAEFNWVISNPKNLNKKVSEIFSIESITYLYYHWGQLDIICPSDDEVVYIDQVVNDPVQSLMDK